MSTEHTSGSIGFVGLLTIALIVLKLLGKISLSWVWVLAPIWITTCLTIVILVFVLLIAALLQR